MGAIDEEQAFVDAAYRHLASWSDDLHARVEALRTSPSVGTVQDELERQAQFDLLAQQIRAIQAADTRLCFGRIDLDSGESHHIGRIGLRDDAGERILLDWRAPNAAGFYQATALNPMGVDLRRRIITRGRQVVHTEDEDLDDPTSTRHDAAAAAVERPTDGRMGDIIATIAADQDAIIRSPMAQITVVEGGPGTGKTVVALHRAAWLLYTYRERLAKDGVLVIGPSTAFLHYIEMVLPSLGETDVVLLTPGQLVPGITARRRDDSAVAAVKGDLRMVQVMARAVRQRRRIPDRDLTIDLEDGSSVSVTRRELVDAERQVPRSATHHAGRDTFLTRVLDALARDRCRRRGDDPSNDDHRLDALADLVADRHVRRTLNLMWLPVEPTALVGRLLTEPGVLRQAADGILTPAEQHLLLREEVLPWTVDDVPLIDEAAHLLGDFQRPTPAATAPEVAELHSPEAAGPTDTLAERALRDREWVYGHVIVDEAQELSRMAWHCIARRCTRRSMTIVGDLQQTAHPAGASSWAQALADIGGTVDVHTLTVTYRITRQIADAAIALLVAAGGTAPDLRPIRDGAPVAEIDLPDTGLAGALAEAALQEEGGRACIIAPDATLDRLSAELVGPDFGFGDDALDAPIAVLAAADTKGLEFDTVIVIDPDLVGAQTPRGADIYVACTRATKRLILARTAR